MFPCWALIAPLLHPSSLPRQHAPPLPPPLPLQELQQRRDYTHIRRSHSTSPQDDITDTHNMLFTRQSTDADPHGGFVFYHYEPSMAAAIIFVLLFGASAILHSVQMGMTRTWFMIPFLIGGYCKCKIILVRNEWNRVATDLISSRDRWIHWARDVCNAGFWRVHDGTVHHAECAAACCTCALCCLDLHGAGQDCAHGRWRTPSVHQEDLVDKAVRGGRCAVIPDAVFW